MRIRQVRREFWTDRRIALLPESTRLFYIGLWAVSDDAGYLRADLPQIAGELFPFDGFRHREAAAERNWTRLVEEGRVVVLECGRHARIPTLPEHQKIGGDKAYTLRLEHERECSIGLRRTMEPSPGNVTVSNGKEGGVGETTRPADAPQGAAPGGLKVRLGEWDAIVGGKS